MKQSEETLFNRRFTFIDSEKAHKITVASRCSLFDDEGAIEVCFTTGG